MEGEVVGQPSPFLSTDPNAGAAPASPFLSTDPDAGGLTTFHETNEKDAQGNAVVRGVSSAWDALNTPLVPQIADAAHAIAAHIDAPKLDRSVTEAQIRGYMAGTTDAVGKLASGFTSPIGLALTLAGLSSESTVVKSVPALKSLVSIPEVQTLQRAVQATAGAGFTAHGASRMVNGETTGDKLQGLAEAASGVAGTSNAIAPTLARWSASRNAASMGSAYAQSTRDLQAALGVNAADVHAARPFLEAVHANGIPIAGKEDAAAQLVKAGNAAIDEIEGHVASVVQQFPGASAPAPAPAIIAKVAQMPGASASDQVAARKVIAQYGLNQPRSLADAESLRVRLNAENRAVLEGSGVRQRTAAMTDPAFVARQQAADSLREGIYGTLEQNGVQGIRDLRRSEGAVIALRDAADRLTTGRAPGLKSEATVARTGESSLARRLAQQAVRAGGAMVGDVVAGPFGAAVGAEMGDAAGSRFTVKNLSKNALIERAFSQSFTSPPIMSVQGFRPPSVAVPSAGALPSAASPRLLPPVPTTDIYQGYRR